MSGPVASRLAVACLAQCLRVPCWANPDVRVGADR